MSDKQWWVYVIQSQNIRYGKKGNILPGFHYVGATTDPRRRIRQHNGAIVGGGKYTSQHRPWLPRALYGPYEGKSEALKAEYALKKGKRGTQRTQWDVSDSPYCKGLGPLDPWVLEADTEKILAEAKESVVRPVYSRRRKKRKKR